jgi:hypothetical protein
MTAMTAVDTIPGGTTAYHGGKHSRGRYHHGGRYWGHRYYYRPWNWRALGCIVVGPVWYCP